MEDKKQYSSAGVHFFIFHSEAPFKGKISVTVS